MVNDRKYVEKAIEMAELSYREGAFPAGAVIVCNNEIIAETTSAQYPRIIYHAESKAIDLAMDKLDSQLSDCTLYCSMQPCLMCLSRAYWAGIRKIVYAVDKSAVPAALCYESTLDHRKLLENFNNKIEVVQIQDFQELAMKTVNKWIKENTINE